MKTSHVLTRFSFLLVLFTMIFAACAPVASVPADVALAEPVQSEDLAALPLEVGAYQAADLRDKGAFILDVRENDEPRDQSIVVVCRTGNRSAVARDQLLAAGFESVTSMYGGFVAWEKEGYEVEKGQ